jgi:hypothetical protein
MGKFVKESRLKEAIGRLARYDPALLAFLAMKLADVPYDTPVRYGSASEKSMLEKYFLPPGAPVEKKYYTPFSGWVNERYPETTLQRARTSKNDAGSVFANGLIHPDRHTFAFHKDVLRHLTARFPKTDSGEIDRINVLDMLVWMKRNDDWGDAPNIPAEVDRFRQEFHLSEVEFNTIFVFANEDPSLVFTDTHLTEAALIRLLEGRQAQVRLSGSERSLLDFLETHIREEGKLVLPDGFVRRVYTALKAQNFVILMGKPGTGKSRFIKRLLVALMDYFQAERVYEVFRAISPEFSEIDVLGYENLEGKHVKTEFVDTLFDSAAAIDRNGVFFIVLDEFNLAEADRYLAKILPAIESDQAICLPAGKKCYLPADTFIIGTANSYLDEPSRLPLSGPVRRRAHLIEMPNYLTNVLKSDPDNFPFLLGNLCGQAANSIMDRATLRGESFLDESRLQLLRAVEADPNVLGEDVITFLLDFCVALTASHLTALTFGVLQDAAEYLALAKSYDEDLMTSGALDEAISQKLLPQIGGPVEVVESLLELFDAKSAHLPKSIEYSQNLVRNADQLTRTVQPLA